MNGQMIDMGLNCRDLQSYLQRVGYWGDAERRQRNAYVLSPSAYCVSARQRADLERLSLATYASVESLSARLSQIAHKTKKVSNDEARFLALAASSTRGLTHPGNAGGSVPPVLKVDLVQNAFGKYFIAEVDVYNPRGFGYLAFLDGSIPTAYRTNDGIGIPLLAHLLHAKRGDRGVWKILLSQFERYYETTFTILADTLRQYGVDIELVHEAALNTSSFESGYAHVFCIPESMDHNTSARARLVELWECGDLNVFYPPAAYLGSKAFLPYLRTQPGMEEFVPDCSLVHKKSDPFASLNGTPVVLKGVMSSGLKQVVFRDSEPQRFDTQYAAARAIKNPRWILQHQVEQEAVPTVVFDDEGDRLTQRYYLRLTAYVWKDGLLGLEATGRTDRAVHGAKDCIQIPAIYV